MIIDIITIFPEMFSPVFGETIIKRAQLKGLVKINVRDLRNYSDDAHGKVDAPSYGGGAGMVFRPGPLFNAVESILGYKVYPKERDDKNKRIILFSPKGDTLNQKITKRLLKYERLILIAPRYEGVDDRVRQKLADEELSIGDYVLSGGELAAMVLVDCLVRLIPGVVSDSNSVKAESFEGGLDFFHYTRPDNFRGLEVPKILLSGDHQKIKKWRNLQSLKTTKERRPDLL